MDSSLLNSPEMFKAAMNFKMSGLLFLKVKCKGVFLAMDSSLPTAKVNFIAPKMDIFVREDLGDLLEELFQKLVNAFLRRVHWSLKPIFFTSGVVAPGFAKRNCV